VFGERTTFLGQSLVGRLKARRKPESLKKAKSKA
jgi:hypothetical protein